MYVRLNLSYIDFKIKRIKFSTHTGFEKKIRSTRFFIPPI